MRSHQENLPHHKKSSGDGASLAICSSQGAEMSSAIALEAQQLVREAAGNTSGLTIKGQIRQAARNLGYPSDSWRVREAWYAGAGCWSAQAIRDLQQKAMAWRTREAARVQHDNIIRAQRDRELLERSRDECRATLDEIEEQLAFIDTVLGTPGPHLDWP